MASILPGELLEFTTTDNARLYGFLQRPKVKTKTCILHIHGMTGNFYRSKVAQALAQQALKNKLAFCAINTRGHDILVHIPRKKKSFLGGTAVERFEDNAKDLHAAIKALQLQGFSQIILSGHSTGCQKIAHYQYLYKNKAVGALVLLAPADDYNSNKERYGKKFERAKARARALIKQKKGDIAQEAFRGFSARRFLSVADLKYIEARLFNYKGPLREVSSIKTPILAVFGKQEEHATTPVAQCLDILGQKAKTRCYAKLLLAGNHSFKGKEAQMAKEVVSWLRA